MAAKTNLKVHVLLGMHVNFYHSWRGDTPDESGFGVDMRVIRGVLDILERANAAGQQARVYWDSEVYWTFQEIVPKYCPDVLQRIRARVAAGLDEIVPGPFNNGANHAATEDEFRACLAWALENPWGSGLRQLFGRVAPLYRPQEAMFTSGQETILRECGLEGLLLYYALVPFNTLAAFTPALTLQQRFNPFWFRSSPEEPRLVVLPCMSAGDVMDQVSLETMLLDLHDRQQRGEIQTDVAVHLNEDADLETWLPLHIPGLPKNFPNTGGLQEYIDVVNRYPWAQFSLPGEYLAGHPPQTEVLVRQDLADGAFDGNYSWAEKFSSLSNWTELEASRMASYRAEVLARRSGLNLDTALWEGMESAFFKRLIGLSTTHFGMSTPVINEQRQQRAAGILGEARQLAEAAERAAASAIQDAAGDGLYEFELYATPPARGRHPLPARCAVSLPLILPPGVKNVRLQTADGSPVAAGLVEPRPLPQGGTAGELRFTAQLGPDAPLRLRVLATESSEPARAATRLQNAWLEVDFSEANGIDALRCQGETIGGVDFLRPFVSYRAGKRPTVCGVQTWKLLPLPGETAVGPQRVRLQAEIPMRTPAGEFVNTFTYTFSLFDDLPHLLVDVDARFAATPCDEAIDNSIQKLTRLMDLRWVEVAPFQLHPALSAPADQPLRVWKHNYLGKTRWYDLDYGRINPRNRNLDAFNHQVTAGWVAVTDGQRGLLLGENADVLASMAFCPMRLREWGGRQQVWLNPFGSYHGRMLDYSHIGARGLGGEFLQAVSGFMKPNGPSYNGRRLRFALLLAPYSGDEPPAELQAQAAAHFYPPGVVFQRTPPEVPALLPADVRRLSQVGPEPGLERIENRAAPVVKNKRGLLGGVKTSLMLRMVAQSGWSLLRARLRKRD